MDILQFERTKYLRVLLDIYDRPNCTQSQLCGAKITCDRTKCTRLSQLVDDGLVKISDKKTYSLTSAGLQVVTLLHAIEAIPTEKREAVSPGDQSTG